MDFFPSLLSPNFMPHGYCYLWDARMVWLHVIADGLIALSYYCIPVILVHFVRKNRDLPLNRVFWMFAGFVLACGTTHLMEIWNIWHGSYLLAGIIKAITAAVSVITAAMLVSLVPRVMALPERMHLQKRIADLEEEIAERKRIGAPIEARLRRKVKAGFAVAVLLTGFLGLLSWRIAQRAAEDSDWVAHTQEVTATLEFTLRHLVDAESGGRGFAITGYESYLEPFETGRHAVEKDLQALRILVQDNPDQERRLSILDGQANARIEATKEVVALRQQTRAVPTELDLEQGKQIMDAARATVEQMQSEERRLLEQRTGKARAAQHFTISVIGLASVLGVVFLSMGGFAVSREMGISAQARGQVDRLNADLERRVEERTAALRLEVTERQRAQEANERLAAVVEYSDNAIISKTLDGTITSWNPAAEKLLGYSASEAVGKSMRMLSPPGRMEEESGILARIGRGEGVEHFETVRVRKDGKTIDISATISPIRDKRGVVVGASKIARDITERKRAEEFLVQQALELAQSRQAFEAQTLVLQSVLDSIAEGLVAADEHGRFVLWNPAAEAILGLGPVDLPRQDWPRHYGFYLPDTVTPLPVERDPLIRALRGEANTTEMFVRNHKITEGAWIEVNASPLRDKKGVMRGGVAAIRDITRQKEDEREIRKLNEELEHKVATRTAQLEAANKELEAFSYSVSHDLRAPLRHISGFSKMLVEEYRSVLDSNAQHYLDRIQAGAQKMGLLVDELLTLAWVGRQTLNRQPTGLNSIVEEVIAMLQPESEGRQVEWMIADLPVVECDPVLVKQVFQNLLANALKFTGSRVHGNGSAGAITTRPAGHTVIEVNHKEENGATVFVVRDNGIGFNMKYVDKLFGVFQRLHSTEEFEGTGIGLATVQRIVQKHGGRVWAEGELDKGAAFYFTLGAGKHGESKNTGATAGGRL